MTHEVPGPGEDPDLSARFQELKRAQQRQLPSFRSVVDRDVRPPEREAPRAIGRGWMPALAFAAAVAALLLVSRGMEPDPPEPPWVAGQWTMPTDVLLDLSTLPGEELLHELPSIGALPVETPEGAHRTSSKRRIAV